jgi:L-cystine transport system substrate-binding protein
MIKINVSRKRAIVFLAVLLAAVMLAGLGACGGASGSTSGSAAEDASGASGDAAPAVIPVGVMSTAKPDAYIDDDGNLTGYDVEVLKAIDELLPQYELDFQTMEFAEILNGLATGRLLAGSQEFEWNAEREATYLFGKTPLIGYNTFVITLNDPQYENITGLADLAGKSTLASQGGSVEAIINAWNEEHPDLEIKKVVSAGTSEDYVNFLNNKVVDFIIGNEQVFLYWTESFGVKEGDWVFHDQAKVYDSNSYILFEKSQTQLQQDFDEALQKLTDDGKLAELSLQFYGKDYTVH